MLLMLGPPATVQLALIDTSKVRARPALIKNHSKRAKVTILEEPEEI